MDDVCEVASSHVLLGAHLECDRHLGVVGGQQVHNTASSAASGRDALRWVLQSTLISVNRNSSVHAEEVQTNEWRKCVWFQRGMGVRNRCFSEGSVQAFVS
jgi:hypothetical protein